MGSGQAFNFPADKSLLRGTWLYQPASLVRLGTCTGPQASILSVSASRSFKWVFPASGSLAHLPPCDMIALFF